MSMVGLCWIGLKITVMVEAKLRKGPEQGFNRFGITDPSGHWRSKPRTLLQRNAQMQTYVKSRVQFQEVMDSLKPILGWKRSPVSWKLTVSLTFLLAGSLLRAKGEQRIQTSCLGVHPVQSLLKGDCELLFGKRKGKQEGRDLPRSDTVFSLQSHLDTFSCYKMGSTCIL